VIVSMLLIAVVLAGAVPGAVDRQERPRRPRRRGTVIWALQILFGPIPVSEEVES
jgi:hypothetical protein